MMREDNDVAEEMLGILRGEEIDVIVSAETVKVEGHSGSGVRVVLRTGSGEKVIEGSDLLVAVGRVPNTAGIGLEAAGIEVNGGGYIFGSEGLQSVARGVWARSEAERTPSG